MQLLAECPFKKCSWRPHTPFSASRMRLGASKRQARALGRGCRCCCGPGEGARGEVQLLLELAGSSAPSSGACMTAILEHV